MTHIALPLLRSSIALAVMTSLAACGDAETSENALQTVGDDLAQQNAAIPLPPSEDNMSDPSPTAPPDGEEQGQAEGGLDGAAPLPPPGAFRFVGMWAAKEDMCDGQAWRFTRENMETPAGSVCKFVNATPVPGGYDISARCTSEGPPTDDNLTIRFAESAQAMLFEAESIAGTGLVYCGPLDR